MMTYVIQDSKQPDGKNFFRRLPGGRWQFTSLGEATTFKTFNKAKQAIRRYLEEYYDKTTGEILTEEEFEKRQQEAMEPYFKPLRDLEGGATGETLQEIQCTQEWVDTYFSIEEEAFKAADERCHWRTSTTARVLEVKTELV